MKKAFIIIGIRAFLFIAGVLLLLNAILLSFVANFHSGIVFIVIIGAVLLLYGIFFRKLGHKKWLHAIMAAGLISGCCLITFIAVYGNTDTVTYNEDVLIVLGAAIKGEAPSFPLYARLEVAADYHARNPGALILVSGGQGFQETITEALAMKRHLLQRGIPQDKIVMEEKATSTHENFKYAKELLDEHFAGQYTAAFVTSDFHIFRATRVAKSLGFTITHCQAPILWYTIPANYLRECAAVMRDLLIGSR